MLNTCLERKVLTGFSASQYYYIQELKTKKNSAYDFLNKIQDEYEGDPWSLKTIKTLSDPASTQNPSVMKQVFNFVYDGNYYIRMISIIV